MQEGQRFLSKGKFPLKNAIIIFNGMKFNRFDLDIEGEGRIKGYAEYVMKVVKV